MTLFFVIWYLSNVQSQAILSTINLCIYIYIYTYIYIYIYIYLYIVYILQIHYIIHKYDKKILMILLANLQTTVYSTKELNIMINKM